MECYKDISKKFGVPEYKILADLFRIFYTDKKITKQLHDNKKIDKDVYLYLLDNWPDKTKDGRIKWLEDREELPSEVSFYGGTVKMIWKINKKINRKNDEPSMVEVLTFSNNTYIITEFWFKNSEGKFFRSNDRPSFIQTNYDANNVKNNVEMKWIEGEIFKRKNDKPVAIYDYEDELVEEWRDTSKNILNFYRGNDLPAVIFTFKKTGNKRLEWFSEPGMYMHFRKNDKPSIIDEDGTQYWTLKSQPDDFHYYNDEYREKFSIKNKFGREDPTKPSIIKTDGTRIWYYRGLRHSLNDKPAMIKGDGTQVWYEKGYIHREGNPAVIYPDGKEEWWTKGVKREEKDLLQKKLKNNDVVDKIMRLI